MNSAGLATVLLTTDGRCFGSARRFLNTHSLGSSIMARLERSAGVVVFHVDSARNERRYLLLDYGRHWDYPKGHVEKKEDDRSAALRELQEETGITQIELDPTFCHQIEYFFRGRDKQLIHKQVVFYLGETNSLDVMLSHEHVGYAFLNYDAALAKLSYVSAKQILRLAEAHLAAATK